MPVRLPSLEEQTSVSSALRLLDGKIELNHKINETLELMARAILKSWFIDFDPVHAKLQCKKPYGMDDATSSLFPDSFERTELGNVPKGWRVGQFGDLAKIIRDGVNPGDAGDQTFHHYSLPAFDEGQRPRKELGSEIKSNKFIVKSNDILISKLNPATPRVWLLGADLIECSVCSTEFMVIRKNNKFLHSYIYLLLTSPLVLDPLVQTATGTSNSHQRTKPEVLLSVKIPIPTDEVLEKFEATIMPLLSMLLANRKEGTNLSEMRDLLLPRMLSGEFSLKETP